LTAIMLEWARHGLMRGKEGGREGGKEGNTYLARAMMAHTA
jgi:hypothetical protein